MLVCDIMLKSTPKEFLRVLKGLRESHLKEGLKRGSKESSALEIAAQRVELLTISLQTLILCPLVDSYRV